MDNAQVTEAEELFDAIYGNVSRYAEWGIPSYREAALRTINDVLARHRLERSEPVGWMGIESAPKDWTDVLVFSPEHEGFNCGGVFSAFYAEGEENCWFAHGPAHNIRLNPTHWQPLPSAPGTTTPEPVAEIERLRELLRQAEQREIDLMAELSGTDQINITLVDLVRRAMRLLPEGKSLWWDEAKGVMDLVDASHAIAAAALGDAS